jgi:hypothetical protein
LELSDEPCSKSVANQFTTEVEVTRGPIADAACNSQTKLVEPKLEMVRAGGLFTIVFVGSILVIVFSAMRSAAVYKEALARANADPAVIEALGSPIKDGFLVSGNTYMNRPSGKSNLVIPISGPQAKGTIYVWANKSLGRWNYSGLVVKVRQTHQRIDLLQKSVPANPR